MTYGAGAAGPHAVTGLGDGTVLTYDANGNLEQKVKASQTLATYTWDAENRLTQVQQVPPETTVPISLQPGWNFFALPVEPANAAVSAVLNDPAITQVSRYNAASTTWSHWVNDPEFDEFTSLEPGVGYQVYCTSAVTLSVIGKPISGLTKSLGTGWHLLGATNATGTLPLASWLSGVTASQVKTLRDATGTLAAATQVDPGQGYWVQITTGGTWAPPSPPPQVTTFAYDGDGGRVKQTTAAGTTIYLGETYEQTGSTTTKYVFAGSQRIAAKDSTGALRFYHGDHLGSSNIVTNGLGTLIELNEQTPFGSLSRHEGTTDVAHKFTGQRLDQTGLYFYQARYYDPALGRFLSPDPFVQDPSDPQTLNRYSYVRNNPVNFVDPSGYGWFRKLIAAIVAVFVAVVVTVATDGCVSCGVAAGASTYVALSGSGNGSSSRNAPSNSAVPSAPSTQPVAQPQLGLPPPTGPPAQANVGLLPLLGTVVAVPDPTDIPLGALLLAGGAAYLLSTYGARALRQATEEVSQTSYDRDNAIISYYSTNRANAETILITRSFRGMPFHPLNRGGPHLHTNNAPFGAKAEARYKDAVLQVYATPHKLLKLPFAPPYTFGINQFVWKAAKGMGFDAMSFPSTQTPGTINYVFFRYEEAIPITQVQ